MAARAPSSATSVAGASAEHRPSRAIRFTVNALIGLLGLEFLLGMAVNLYVEPVPTGSLDLGSGLAPAEGALWIAHLLNALALVATALLLVVLFLRRSQLRSLQAGALFALGGVLIAAAGGFEFVVGSGAPGYSLLMAVGFLVAFWSSFWIRVRLAQGAAPAPSSRADATR